MNVPYEVLKKVREQSMLTAIHFDEIEPTYAVGDSAVQRVIRHAPCLKWLKEKSNGHHYIGRLFDPAETGVTRCQNECEFYTFCPIVPGRNGNHT